jgi:RNA polymerase sigma-70 factor, ECF subfamily
MHTTGTQCLGSRPSFATKRRVKEEALDLETLNEDALDAVSPSALESFDTAMQAHRVTQCMQALSASHKQCVALAFYQGLSHSEVAAHLGAPLGSVKAWIKRGLTQMRDCLEKVGVKA